MATRVTPAVHHQKERLRRRRTRGRWRSCCGEPGGRQGSGSTRRPAASSMTHLGTRPVGERGRSSVTSVRFTRLSMRRRVGEPPAGPVPCRSILQRSNVAACRQPCRARAAHASQIPLPARRRPGRSRAFHVRREWEPLHGRPAGVGGCLPNPTLSCDEGPTWRSGPRMRREWDLNPRTLACQRFSRPSPSAARTPLLGPHRRPEGRQQDVRSVAGRPQWRQPMHPAPATQANGPASQKGGGAVVALRGVTSPSRR